MLKCILNVLFCLFAVVTPYFGPLLSCDESDAFNNVPEGNVGESGHFRWIGVIRVHLHIRAGSKIALVGIVLVKFNYAIANAYEMSQIPEYVLKSDSKAMFLIDDGKPWFVDVESYKNHPEYEYPSLNTISVVKLALGVETNPIKPICFPSLNYKAGNDLYAVGFTDENKLLEKVIYKIQYIDHKLCNEFYERAEMTERHLWPEHYQCGYAKNKDKNCLWDGGMVLASNATGVWKMIGFGISGPGCGAPSRFIDTFSYFNWIGSATIDEDDFDVPP